MNQEKHTVTLPLEEYLELTASKDEIEAIHDKFKRDSADAMLEAFNWACQHSEEVKRLMVDPKHEFNFQTRGFGFYKKAGKLLFSINTKE